MVAAGGRKIFQAQCRSIKPPKSLNVGFGCFFIADMEKRQGSELFVKAGFASVVLPMRRLPEMMTMRLASSSTRGKTPGDPPVLLCGRKT